MKAPPAFELQKLEDKLEKALNTGDRSDLRVLGYGEISCVLHLDWEGSGFACKRLPIFDGKARFDAYASTFQQYLSALQQRGVAPTESELCALPQSNGMLCVYCIQPELPSYSLLPEYMRAATEDVAVGIFLQIVDVFRQTASQTLGIDGQLSNWALLDGKLLYLDVTTPLLRTSEGKEKLDLDLFLASLPYPLRLPIKRWMLKQILDKYYDARGITLDLFGNLIKEKLDHLIPAFLGAIKDHFAKPITEPEIKAYYKEDAQTWELLQRLRRADRFIQQKILRRTYPFLLPGPIQR